MKFKAFSFLLLASLYITSVAAKPIKITGSLLGSQSLNKVYLYEYIGPKLNKIDSTTLKSDKFTFTYKNGLPRGFYNIGVSEAQSFPLILGDESPVISADLKNLPASVKVENSKEYAVYEIYKDFNIKFNEQVAALEQKAKQSAQKQTTDPQGYEADMKKLQGTYDSLVAEQNKFYSELAAKNQGLFAGKMIDFFTIDQNVSPENYFDDKDLKDIELTRGHMLPTKISIYFQRFVQPDVEEWRKAAEQIINKTPAASKNREATYISIVNLFASADADLARQVAKKYKTEFPKSSHATATLAALPSSGPEIGDVAPEIVLNDLNGKALPLSSLKGKVVLLDFWAAWCGPCRKENPNVVRVYNKYKNKGFTVYSVSLDRDKDSWTKAIETDGLVWKNHVSDLQFWKSAGAATYSVKSIPTTYLIGKDGKIIAKNLRGAKLEEKLTELFGN